MERRRRWTEGRAPARAKSKVRWSFFSRRGVRTDGAFFYNTTKFYERGNNTQTQQPHTPHTTRALLTHTFHTRVVARALNKSCWTGDLGSGMARGPTRAARASWLTGGGASVSVTAMHQGRRGPTRRSRSRCPSAPARVRAGRVRVVRLRVVRAVVCGFGVRVRVSGRGAAPSRAWRRRQGVGVSRSTRPGLGCVCGTSVPGRSCCA